MKHVELKQWDRPATVVNFIRLLNVAAHAARLTWLEEAMMETTDGVGDLCCTYQIVTVNKGNATRTAGCNVMSRSCDVTI